VDFTRLICKLKQAWSSDGIEMIFSFDIISTLLFRLINFGRGSSMHLCAAVYMTGCYFWMPEQLHLQTMEGWMIISTRMMEASLPKLISKIPVTARRCCCHVRRCVRSCLPWRHQHQRHQLWEEDAEEVKCSCKAPRRRWGMDEKENKIVGR
jgi:hypothetical protein